MEAEHQSELRGCLDLGYFIYNSGIADQKLDYLLSREENIVIVPANNSKISKFRTKLCDYERLPVRCKYKNHCFWAHSKSQIRKTYSPISLSDLRLCTRQDRQPRIKIYLRIDQLFDSDVNDPAKEFQFKQIQEALSLFSQIEETNHSELKDLREKHKIILFDNMKLSSRILHKQKEHDESHKQSQKIIDNQELVIQEQKEELKRIKSKYKQVLSYSFSDSANYKGLFLYLIEQINELLASPICFGRLKSPVILKSGQTIDEFEFDELASTSMRDPYDRTKSVDCKIRNFLVSKIMESVEQIEKLQEISPRFKHKEASTQTDDPKEHTILPTYNTEESDDKNATTLTVPKVIDNNEMINEKVLTVYGRLVSIENLLLKKAKTKESESDDNTSVHKIQKKIKKLRAHTKNLDKTERQNALKIIKHILCRSIDYEFSNLCMAMIKEIQDQDIKSKNQEIKTSGKSNTNKHK